MPVLCRTRAVGLPLLVLSVVFAGLIPSVGAAPYEGPGQTGVVKLGEGGLTLPFLGGVTDDATHATITGIPAGACRLVLDQNGTFADARLAWTPGDADAHVWADVGKSDVRYRLHAVWHTDLNGNCTAEETQDGTIWHDPRGRPFVDLSIVEGRVILEARAGGDPTELRLHAYNNGTIADNVTAGIKAIHPDFTAVSVGKVRQVAVGPRETVPFVFEIRVPSDGQRGVNTIQVGFSSESGWARAFTLHLDVRPATGNTTPDAAPDPASADPLPPPHVVQEDAPLPLVVVLLASILALASRRRR